MTKELRRARGDFLRNRTGTPCRRGSVPLMRKANRETRAPPVLFPSFWRCCWPGSTMPRSCHNRGSMRFVVASWTILLLLLAGCAATPLPQLDVSSREPVCARRCLEIHSSCISGAGAAFYPAVAVSTLNACHSNAQQCLSLCPAK